jgi:hypothetical protein
MAKLIKVDGTEQNIKLNPKDTLKTLQTLVGGYIQYVKAPIKIGSDKFTGFVCNEDGYATRLQFNPKASKLWNAEGTRGLVGDVVFLKTGELK